MREPLGTHKMSFNVYFHFSVDDICQVTFQANQKCSKCKLHNIATLIADKLISNLLTDLPKCMTNIVANFNSGVIKKYF